MRDANPHLNIRVRVPQGIDQPPVQVDACAFSKHPDGGDEAFGE
ncbi:hypothetical protein [Streptomyces sp. NPDC048248]